MENRTKHIIPLKSGDSIPMGSEVRWKGGKALVHIEDRIVRISALAAARALGIEIPDVEMLEEYLGEGGCESVLGSWVEPDGIDEDGSPSWLLALGLI